MELTKEDLQAIEETRLQWAEELPICGVCYGTYDYKGVVPARVKNGCKHAFCKNCIDHVDVNRCPLCRKDRRGPIISSGHPVTEPDKFFDFADVDENGKLSPEELFNALQHVSPMEGDKALEKVVNKWGDVHPSGITRSVYANNIASEVKWFNFWDTDKDGTLNRYEVACAMAYTFKKGKPASIEIDEGFYEMVIFLFNDADNGETGTGDGNGVIDFEEFFGKGEHLDPNQLLGNILGNI